MESGSQKICVAAPEGLKCPMEGRPREYITGPTWVYPTPFYLRLLAEGSLIRYHQSFDLAATEKEE